MPPERRDWDSVANDPDFKKLMAAKRRFIIPATIFSSPITLPCPSWSAMRPS